MKKQEIINMVKAYLDKEKITYIKESMNCQFKKDGKLRNNEVKPLYMVSFLRTFSEEGTDEDLYFFFIDAKSFKPIYIMTSHGYIEV